MGKDYFFGLDIVYIGAFIFFIAMVIYLFWISRKGKKDQ
jgi:cbb3-type cytochrome oxidase subunit 3